MNRTQLIIKFYNKITGLNITEISQIPVDIYLFINHMGTEEIARPLIVEEIKRTKISRAHIALKYGIAEGTARKIKRLCPFG